MPTPGHPTAAAQPTDCERILFIGAGGFGREALAWARDAWPADAGRFAGFLSDDPLKLDGFCSDLRILGSLASYVPSPADALVLAIGIPGVRRRVAESLIARGCRFLSLIHPTAIVAATAVIGAGSILCPYSIASDHARLGRFTLMNYHSSVAHDAATGDFAVLSPYATLGGGAGIGDDVFLGLHASVGPGVRIGDRSKVSANSCALAHAGRESLIHGVPGRISPLISPES
jgi:sugar O-acyltransferase (sialic acid O-acetyltransferase NeuD family)